MQSETNILLIGIIAMLVVIISVLLWRNLRSQRELREKNDAIIREIQENVKLREELRRRIPHAAVF
jgi:sensor domain CHASE-containing protein